MNAIIPDSHNQNEDDAPSRDQTRLAASGGDESGLAATDRDMSQYTMTVEEATAFFQSSGVGRDKRAIERYCQFNHIDAIRIKTSGGAANDNGTYLLDPDSVRGKIQEVQQFEDLKRRRATSSASEARQGEGSRDVSRSAAADRDEPRQGPAGQNSAASSTDSSGVLPQDADAQLKKENELLHDEILNLKIDNRAKEQVITMLNKERTSFMDTIRNMSFQIGGLTTRLGLSAPPPEGAVDNSGIESQPPV